MNLKYTALGATILTCASSILTAAPLVDDFSGGLDPWTLTTILDAVGAGSNIATFQINDSGALELNTSSFDGIEQYAYIRDGAFLDVGEEAQLDMTIPLTGDRNLGLYVGGSAPIPHLSNADPDPRFNYISNYTAENGQPLATRGFDGSTEYANIQSGTAGQVAETLFIARTETNTFEIGYYTASERIVYETRTPDTQNNANFVGIYGDSRVMGIMGEMTEFRIAAPQYIIVPDNTEFRSGLMNGERIALLEGSVADVIEASSFSLVAGPGDTDNALFQIGGPANDELQINADFTASGLDPASGTQYFVRIRGEADASSNSGEDELILTLTKDDDLDDLDDDWELMWRPTIADLDGTGMADFDGDLLFDIEEFQLSTGTLPGVAEVFPTIDPSNDDTDGDLLLDGEEVLFTVGARPFTNPILADTDDDGLTDFEETNSGLTETLPSVGTDPTLTDTDGDGAKDGFEIDNSGDPLSDLSHPNAASPNVTITRITDDASSEISSTRVYTHTVSGGSTATVGGVIFDTLDATNSVPNFDWTVDGDGRNTAVTNGGQWDTVAGGVTGTEIIELLTGFGFSNTANTPGERQTYTLSGLTPGTSYDLRLYTRQWRDEDSGRPIDLTFINGTEEVTPYCSLLMDRPGFVLNDPSLNHDQAYFMSYTYTAQEDSLVIEAAIPIGFDSNDTLHLYALTNEDINAVPVPSVDIEITAVSVNSNGEFVIDFTGPANNTFTVRKSQDLQDGFVETAATVTAVTTDASGIGQAIITAAEASEPTEFYRLEN